MLLALNLGNTELALGLLDPAAPPAARLRFTAALAADSARTADEYAVLLGQLFALRGFSPDAVTDVIIASVVPALLDTVCAAVAAFTAPRAVPPAIVGPGMRTGIRIRIDAPAQLGADLVALAAGAHPLCAGPAAVVSLDTATTVTVLDGDGAICGTVILPGIGSAADALARDAALLMQTPLTPPRHVIGRSTADSVRAGLFFGTAAQIDGLCDRIEDELGLEAGTMTVLAAGRWAPRVMPLCRRAHTLCPDLLFAGLFNLWSANR